MTVSLLPSSRLLELISKSELLNWMENESSYRSGILPAKKDSEPSPLVVILIAYYRGAMGILLTYDCTDERSFNNIRNWIRNIEQHASEGVNKILIGNKCDMMDKKVITTEQGKALADEYQIKFTETSAKSNIGVEEAFFSLAR